LCKEPLFEIAENPTTTKRDRSLAILALIARQVRGERVHELIRSDLRSDDEHTRYNLVSKLDRYVECDEFTDELLRMLADDQELNRVRQAALHSLSSIDGLSDETKVEVARHGLTLAEVHRNPYELILSFGQLGAHAKSALPLLDEIEDSIGSMGSLTAARMAINGEQPTITDAWMVIIENRALSNWQGASVDRAYGPYDHEHARRMFIWLLTSDGARGPTSPGTYSESLQRVSTRITMRSHRS